MFQKISIIFMVCICTLTFTPLGFGEIIGKDLGTVNDLLVTDSAVYFFEPDTDIQTSTWVHDTYVMKIISNKVNKVSDSLFIYPTELNEHEGFLYFATLSEQCLGQITCDYQDIIKMSKSDGSYQKIIKDLKSAIHISIGDFLFVSESNGKIWKISLDGKSRHLLAESKNIIMDIASNGDEVYWIEEIQDMNNQIMRVKDGNIDTLAIDLKIPYDLGVYDDVLHWNEIQIGSERGAFAEFTVIKRYHNNNVVIIDEYENTSPISVSTSPHYGPYLQYGNYLFVVNNTNINSVIHLIDTDSKTKFDIASVDYTTRYLRTNSNDLYVIGQNNNGFIIEKFPLPVAIPEFSSVLVFTTIIIGLSLPVFLKRSFHY